MTTSKSKILPSLKLSVFLKCVSILAATTAIVAGVIAMTSDRAIRDIANEGLLQLSDEMTENLSEKVNGAVRFRRQEDIDAILGNFYEGVSDRALGATLLSGEGTPLATVGNLASEDLKQLMRLAEVTLATGASESTADGFWKGQPILNNGETIGALAIAWTPNETLARLDAQRRNQLAVAGTIFLLLTIVSGFFFRSSLARPLTKLAFRTTRMADGDLIEPIPYTSRSDEIGQIAKQLDHFRAKLERADGISREAGFQSAGFQGASAPLVMTDTEFRITHCNFAFRKLIEDTPGMGSAFPNLPREDLRDAELRLDVFDQRKISDGTGGEAPDIIEVDIGKEIFSVTRNQINDSDDSAIGFLMEWNSVTSSRITEAILAALASTQIRMDFDPSGKLTYFNALAELSLADTNLELGASKVEDLLSSESGTPLEIETATVPSTFDTFRLGDKTVVSGSLSPVKGSSDEINGYVFLGHNITEAENAKRTAEQKREIVERDQTFVVEELRSGLDALADGDLTWRLNEPFPETHEELRTHYNDSVASLESAVGSVRDNSTSILSESDNISSAADDLSKRTEQQAATLEQFAASLTELTASVAATAEGAGQASEVVNSARDNAQSSGAVVNEAVEAMGEISNSSEKISRIISVIDDIAFQTNLLALNAGVEAARAGDAGRGFAVVASEVRALAQRSSEAAREINDLISSSGAQVKRGVSLVGRAGEALDSIVGSIGGIADHVASIAASAREQSTGIEEINIAMSQLDQATQQNVAMFEETTAATHTLRSEASSLVSASANFKIGNARNTELRSTEVAADFSLPVKDTMEQSHPLPQQPHTSGALALAASDEDDDWEDF